MASICNDERASSGVTSGHDRKSLKLSDPLGPPQGLGPVDTEDLDGLRLRVALDIQGHLALGRATGPQRLPQFGQRAHLGAVDAQDAVAGQQAGQQLSPMQLSFMSESRRLLNHRLKQELHLRLRYPTVLQGLLA